MARIVFSFIMAAITLFMTGLAAAATQFEPRFGPESSKWYLVIMFTVGAILYGYHTYHAVKVGIREDN